MRLVTSAALATALLLTTPLPAMSAPAGAVREVPDSPRADTDGDRISDGLDAAIDPAAPNDRFEVIVQMSTAHPGRAAARAVGSFTLHREYDIIDGFHATMTVGQIRGLANHPRTTRIQEAGVVSATLDSSNDDFGATLARDTHGVDGTGVGVCVIDSGADPSHEQLDGAKITAWNDFVNGGATPYDDFDHGTHVASIAAGDGTGSSLADRFKGVAPGADLIIAKALDSGGSGSEANIIAAIDWCAAHPDADVINMSFGSLGASDGQDAIAQAANNAYLVHGKLPVAAAGNSGDDTHTVGTPAAGEYVIAVGAAAKHSVSPSSGYHTDGIYIAPFSSVGPSLDGRTKPDVTAPGVLTMAAMNGTTSTYFAQSGTSMAAPYVAGALALALDQASPPGAATLRGLVESTARDRGPAGKDNDWGAGLIDVQSLVSEARSVGSYDATAFPTHTFLSERVRRNGVWSHTFSLTADDLDVPIAASIHIDGQLECAQDFGGWCFAYEWSPDLDARLIAPNGDELYLSQCPLGPDCGGVLGAVGRREVVYAMPTTPGTYEIQVFPYAGAPNNGTGGTFGIDLSHGPLVGGGTPPPPPPPTNDPPVANDDGYSTTQDTQLSVIAPGVLANDTDANGDPITAVLETDVGSGTLNLSADGSFTYTPNTGFTGSDSFTYRADDGTDPSNIATVSITVEATPPPPPPGTVHIGDIDSTSTNAKKNWIATVTITVHDDNEQPVEGATVNVEWDGTTAASCVTGPAGTCSVERTQAKKVGSVTLTVTSVTGVDPYDQPANHDPDGDSTGTSIVVGKP